HLIENADGIDPELFSGRVIDAVGVSAGASTPDNLVEGVIERLLELSGGAAEVVRPRRRRATNELTELKEEVEA
ncbi:MAG TPA: 4-hydroxy-3-methylbut-2-enyl diphosphate reductase, partial [candidate division Zixibacteria bacterium]|nr:4-hydroxy-3-methylbut-2-enyl diphosphate reductase [candidate division Zixibacteria bacterium]